LSESNDESPILVIPNGIDGDFFKPSGVRPMAGNESLRILIASRFHPQKGIPRTLALLAQARGLVPEFIIVIAGDGPARPEIERQIKSSGLSDITRLLGWIQKNEMVGQYQAADCFVNLSRVEGMPNTVLEAMASGLPVIASDIGAHQELITHGTDGFIVSIDHPDEFVRALTIISEDVRNKRELGINGRRKVNAHYSWDMVARKYIALFGPDERIGFPKTLRKVRQTL